MRINYPLVGGTAQARSLDQSSQRTLNLFPEISAPGSRTEAALYSTPGLVSLGSAGTGLPCRSNGVTFKNVLYFISGNQLIGISPIGTIAQYGLLTPPYGTGRCSLVGGASYLMVVDDMANGYAWNGPNGGSGATVSVTASAGAVTGIQNIIVKGAGYFMGDAVGLSGGDGTATAYVNSVDAQGGILSLTVAQTGTTGYTNGAVMSANALGGGKFQQILNGQVQGTGCTLTLTASANQQASATPLMGLTSVTASGGLYNPLNLPTGLVNGYSGYLTLSYGVAQITMNQQLVTSTPATVSVIGAGTGAVAQLNPIVTGGTTYSMGTPTITANGLALGNTSNNTSTVSFIGGGGSGAAGTAVWANVPLPGGIYQITLASINITNPGTGYSSLPQVVIPYPPGFAGPGATATAVLTNPVTTPPTYTYPAGLGTVTMSSYGTGYGAEAYVLINGNSTLASVTGLRVASASVVSPGSWSTFPSVAFSIAGATASNVKANVQGFTNVNGGSGYNSNPVATTFSGGGGTVQATGHGTETAGVVAFTLDTNGSGYTSMPLITVAAPPSATTISAAAVASGGVNYLLNDILTILGGTGDATYKVTSVDTNGAVLAGTVVNAGTNYGGGLAQTSDTQITFFPPAVHCGWMDGYFITVASGTNDFFISTIDNPKTGQWSALNYAAAEEVTGVYSRVHSCTGMLTLFGDIGSQIFYEAGNPNFPFTPVLPNGVIEWGLGALDSVAKCDDSIIWLAKNARGDFTFVELSGLQASVISDQDIDFQVNALAVKTDAFAFFQRKSGHAFYVITFPTADLTLVYDKTTRKWHNRSTFGYNSWRPAGAGYINGMHVVGDRFSDKFYMLDDNTYTDGGLTITRERVGPVYAAQGQRICFNRFEVLMESGIGLQSGQGSAPLLMLSWSDDGGHSWSDFMEGTAGAAGYKQWRVFWNMLGSSYGRIFRLTMTDPVPLSILGAWMDVEGGLTPMSQYSSRGQE